MTTRDDEDQNAAGEKGMQIMNTWTIGFALCGLCLAGCLREAETAKVRTFGEDWAFLKKHTDAVLLSDSGGKAQVIVVPQYQGRVMTSTADGAGGASYGWLNYELIASGKTTPHITVLGGEDRFWLGPEGGQFSIFFKKGDPFDLDHWWTPPVIDTEAYEVVAKTTDSVTFRKRARLTNYSGTKFDLQIDRTVRQLTPEQTAKSIGMAPAAGVRSVAFESESKVTNTGAAAWVKKTGLLSVWILGQQKGSPTTTVVVPFRPGSEADLGPVLNRYPSFGELLPERMQVKGNAVYFRGDGRRRNKIGVFGRRAMGVCGSYDPAAGVLTVVRFNQPPGATDYVNSAWSIQKQPYVGDAISSYNDNPAKGGACAFYELESLSPAAALKPGGSITHVHKTLHFTGPVKELDKIAKATLGVGLTEIESALPKP